MSDASADQSTVDSDAGAATPLWLRAVAIGSIAVVLALAAFFRFYELGRLPGVNADEAWYGVQAHRLLAGEASSWRTPNGNIPGLPHLGLVALLESLFPASFALLRIPAAIASLGAMVLAYWVSGRYFGRTSAIAALLLMAILPMNIAYARFGWDPSYSALLVLPALHAALARKAYLAAAIFAFAVATHPTNLFAGPFLGLAYFGALLEDRREQPWREAVLFAMLLALAVALVAAIAGSSSPPGGAGAMLARMTSPREWGLFALSFVRLLSGDTTLAFLTGEGWAGARTWADAAAVLVLLTTLVAGLFHMRGAAFDRSAGLVAGWVFTLIFFFIVAGNKALEPHHERYGFVLIAPTAVTLAMLIGKCLPRSGAWGRSEILLSSVALLLLAPFWFGYFRPLEQGRADQHVAFWTGPVEPKLAAFERIASSAGSAGALIVAEDWWLEQPIAYLATENPSIRVVWLAEPQAPSGQKTYWVAYRNGGLDRRLSADPALASAGTVRTAYPGHELRLWREADRATGR